MSTLRRVQTHLAAYLLAFLAASVWSAPPNPILRRRALPANQDPPLRVLADGRVVDFRGLIQLDLIVQSHSEAKSPSAADKEIQAQQKALWRQADSRYRVTGTVTQIGAHGIYVQRLRGLQFNSGGLKSATESVYVANYPADNLVDGDRIDAWTYPTGPHRFLNTFHSRVSIPGFDFGTPYAGPTNALAHLVRLLPAGETNLVLRPSP